MNSPLVSIILPCYNSERYLEQTLASLRQQSYKNIEIIAVDDGSTDRTRDILRAQDTRMTIVGGSHRGASAARNVGLQHANGSWIQFLDSDDILSHNKIESQVTAAHERELDRIYTCRWRKFRDDDLAAVDFDEGNLLSLEDPIQWLVEKYRSSTMMPIHAWLVSRQLALQAGPWNEKLTVNDDGEYFDRVVLLSSRVVFCDEGCAYYRTGLQGTLSGTRTDEGFRSQLTSFLLGSTRLLEERDSPEVREACSIALMKIAHNTYPEFSEVADEAETAAKQILMERPLFLPGGKLLNIVERMLGWRTAKKAQRLSRRLRGIPSA